MGITKKVSEKEKKTPYFPLFIKFTIIILRIQLMQKIKLHTVQVYYNYMYEY